MEEMNHLELIDKKEKKIGHIYNIQHEKKYYLGEYRERVLVTLNVEQLINDDIYVQVIETLKDPRAKLMKMRRDIGLTKLKPYIKEAERLNFRYEIVDGLSYLGDIGLVVITDKSLDNEEEELGIRNMDQDFLDAGLGAEFSKNQGKRVCNQCHIIIKDKLPSYLDKFPRLNILDKLFGTSCPVCRDRKKLGGRKK